MLIEFRVTNFRAVRTAQPLSLVADSFAERPGNAFDSGIPKFGRLLRSAVFYGPNAAGKTNFLRALQFMKLFVMASAGTAETFQYTPFKFASATRNAPTEFEVTF